MFWFLLENELRLLGDTWSNVPNLIDDPGGEIFVRMSGTGGFSGAPSNVIGYSYTEGSTPLIPGDESGAIGEISIDVLDRNNASILVYKDEFLLRDRAQGSVVGVVENASSSNKVITMGGRSALAFLNVERTIEAQEGSIEDVITYIFGEVGITGAGSIVYDAALPSTTIYTPGYEGDLWVYVKRLASAYEFEVTVIENVIVVRPSRQRVVDATNIVDENWQIQDIELAQEFDIAYYNYQSESDFLVYPKGGWEPEVTVYQVEANDTVEFEVELEFYLTSVKQPVAQEFVDKDYSGPNSVYSISGNDNLPVSAELWNDFGGDMSFEILGPGNRLKITITGPDFPELSPYSISVSDGSTSYSTLRVIGTGMNFSRELHTSKTGLSPSDTPNLKGAEIDNPVINTLEDAKRAALFARRLYALPRQTFSTSARTFPRIEGSIPPFFYPTFAEYNSNLNAQYSFNNFNSDYGGITFDQFTTQILNSVPQGFGEVSGARVQLGDAFYRVRNVTINPDTIAIDTEYDTLFDDLVAVFRTPQWKDLPASWGGMDELWANVVTLDSVQKKFQDFNETFEGLNFKDYALLPLRQLDAV
jgi:hypothetical protein